MTGLQRLGIWLAVLVSGCAIVAAGLGVGWGIWTFTRWASGLPG